MHVFKIETDDLAIFISHMVQIIPNEPSAILAICSTNFISHMVQIILKIISV